MFCHGCYVCFSTYNVCAVVKSEISLRSVNQKFCKINSILNRHGWINKRCLNCILNISNFPLSDIEIQ